MYKKNATKKELENDLDSLCSQCECLISSMKCKDGHRKMCPWRSISGDYCDFIENLRKAIGGSYNED